MKTLADVTLSFHSLGEVDLDTRAEAASSAGFRLVGLSVRRTVGWLAEHPIEELRDLLERYGLAVGQLEVLTPLRTVPDPLEGAAIDLARELRCPSIQVSGPSDLGVDEGAARLGSLAARAADVGAVISLEFLPWTNLPSVSAAAEVIGRAGHPGAGICVDVWHLYRSGGSLSDLDEHWSLINSIQLDDGPLRPAQPDDLLEDCLHNRLLPGAGEFDLVGLLAAAARHAPAADLTVEVISDELRALSPAEVTARVAQSTSAVLTTVSEVARA